MEFKNGQFKICYNNYVAFAWKENNMKKYRYIYNRYISGIAEDINYHSKEISKFLNALQTKAYIPFENTNDASIVDYYLDDIKVYSSSITYDIKELRNYISFLEQQICLIDPELLDEYELQ